MKIAVIGAGSTYTPELVSGLAAERARLEVDELVLHDIADERREVVGALAARMLARRRFAGALTITGDLDRAVDGADFVLLQIRVGGQTARLGHANHLELRSGHADVRIESAAGCGDQVNGNRLIGRQARLGELCDSLFDGLRLGRIRNRQIAAGRRGPVVRQG